MLELGKQIGRQRAHDAVYEAAQGSVTEGRPFREMLAARSARERRAHAVADGGAARSRALRGALSRVRGAGGRAAGAQIAATIEGRPVGR